MAAISLHDGGDYSQTSGLSGDYYLKSKPDECILRTYS